MRKIMLAVLVTASAFGASPAAAKPLPVDPGFCDDAEVMMERYQYFDDDTQAVIDSLSPCEEG